MANNSTEELYDWMSKGAQDVEDIFLLCECLPLDIYCRGL